jgi:ParB family transcriptional regulator, chromosome partitioning protein
MTAAHTRPISQIRIGTLHRRDLGDLDQLAASIADVGLIHPIAIDSNGLLLAGARRLAAVKLLGWTEIAVTILERPRRTNEK